MQTAVITGFGPGLGERLATRLLEEMTVVGLSRSGKNAGLLHESFSTCVCDVGDPKSVANVFNKIQVEYGTPTLLIHNAAQLLLDDFMEISPTDFEHIWRTTCFGAMLCSQAVIPGMLAAGGGSIVLTGATASVKAGAKSAAFGSAKFALRGLAQALARQYSQQGIHVVHTVIDGVIWSPRAEQVFKMNQAQCIKAQDLADSYLNLIQQSRSTWTHELDIRPSTAVF